MRLKGWDFLEHMIEDCEDILAAVQNIDEDKNLVLAGKDIVFTAIPKENYKIKGWTLQGMPVEADTTFEIKNLSSDIDICVEFEKDEKNSCSMHTH